eukprot:2388936-Prymnesium_polylepis.1
MVVVPPQMKMKLCGRLRHLTPRPSPKRHPPHTKYQGSLRRSGSVGTLLLQIQPRERYLSSRRFTCTAKVVRLVFVE